MTSLLVGLAVATAGARASAPDAPADEADEPTATAEAAEAAGDWATAWRAWEVCAAEATGSTRRYCATRARTLAPYAADGFAGWAILEEVRRNYRTIGSDAALARIEAALAAAPDGPAAPDLRVWLVNEHLRRGEPDEAAALREVVVADPTVAAPTREWVDATGREREREKRERVVAGVAGGIGLAYATVAARGPGPWRVRSAAAAAVLLGVVPAVLGVLYDRSYGRGFGWTGLVAALGVLAAARAPVWVSVPGTLGAMLVAAWGNGWFPDLGL